MLEAYFDESERDGGQFCLAGLAFTEEQAQEFGPKWRSLMGGRISHMKELVGQRGAFADLTRADCDELIRGAIGLINEHIMCGAAVSCNVAEVRALAPQGVRGFGSVYSICCYLSVFALSSWIRKNAPNERVAFFFESGHEFEAEARDFLRLLAAREDFRSATAYYSDAFVPKGSAPALEAADMFAWEWAKFQDETVAQSIRPIRKSLKGLFIDGQHTKYQLSHVTGEPLRKAMAELDADFQKHNPWDD